MICEVCGFAMSEFDVECPRCIRNQQTLNNETIPDRILPGNTSGTNTLPPQEVFDMGWCWGAFGFGVIWGMANRTLFSILLLVPYVSIPVWVLMGLSGHELAWKNRRFRDLNEFKETMAVWNTWGKIAAIIALIWLFLTFWLPISLMMQLSSN